MKSEPDFSLISGRLINEDSGCGSDTPNGQLLMLKDNHQELVKAQSAGGINKRVWFVTNGDQFIVY